MPYSGPDVGGFTGQPSPELYLRWFQMAAYLPFFRTHSSIGAARREPWSFGPEVLEHAGAALRERERLMPYLYTLAQLARRGGAPYVRPLWWGDPEDRGLRGCGDAFLLGDALLVAPVMERGAESRSVRLPRGRWYDTATGAPHEGPGQVLLDAPPGQIPVLARAGAVIPVTGAGGALELEVWAPAAGCTGGGVVIGDAGDGWGEAVVERFLSHLGKGEVVVEGENGGEPRYRVTVRGLP